MNANELADELREVSKHSEPHTQIVLGIAESLLRQQQAEIEALKAHLAKELTDDKIADLIKATNDEIGMKNIRTFDFTKVLLRKAQEK